MLSLCFLLLTGTNSQETEGSGEEEEDLVDANIERDSQNSKIHDQDARDKREEACKGIQISTSLMTDTELEIQRNKDINLFHKSTGLLKDIIQTEDYNKIWDGELWLPIFMTVIFTFTIISVILYAVNICICCDRKRNAFNFWCVKLNLCFAVLALVTLLVCLIGMCIFLSNARKSIKYVNCSINIMNDDLRNGAVYNENIQDQEIKFQGLVPLQVIFEEYGKSMDAIVNENVDEVNEIVSYSLPVQSKAAYDAINPYYDQYKESTTSDGDNNQAIPLSVSVELPTAKTNLEIEFGELYSTSLRVHEAALVAKNVIDSGDPAIYSSAITSANEEIDVILKGIDEYVDLSNSYFGTVANRYDAVQVVYIIFNFLCFILAAVICVGLCMAFKRDKCTNFLIWRIVIFVLGILCLIFFAFTIFVVAISFMSSSSCSVFAEINTEEGIKDFVTTFKASDRFEKIMRSCYIETANGDLGRVFLENNSNNSPEYQIFQDSRTLLSVYEIYNEQVTSMESSPDSKSAQEFDDYLEETRIGIKKDHDNILVRIQELNQLVDCDGIYYALTPVTCVADNSNTCLTIQEETAVREPACLAGEGPEKVNEARARFSTLKTYLNETQILMANMIDGVNGTQAESLNSKYNLAATDFLSASAKFDLIKENQKEAIALFKGDLTTQTDCRIIRLHLQLLEDSICFNTVGELYSFMVCSVIGAILFFCLVWNLCCAEYCIGNLREGFDEIEEEVYESQEVKPIVHENPDDAAEDDFFVNSMQAGYLNQSESSGQPDKNIEYQIGIDGEFGNDKEKKSKDDGF